MTVYKFDRFSRNKFETAIHKKTLKDNGAKVISATEFVPDTPEGIILESMLEGYAEYYSAELSQKIRRGNNESRHKGNLTGGKVPYGYRNENKKAVIVPEQAEVVRHIFERYSAGVYVKDIIAELTSRGILYYGKKFVTNTVYKILKNERYSGIYHYNGEEFDNIYPQIVPTEIFEKVRAKIENNKYGKKSEDVCYLLKDKVKCGYCGKSIVGENGTSREGKRMYYYKCRGRKAHLNDCKKSVIRKEVLEKIVLDIVIAQLGDERQIDYIVRGIMAEQQRQANNNTVMNLLKKEQRNTQTSINNIMSAIEQGVITSTMTKRLKELESRQEELEQQIAIEKNRQAVMLTERQIREYYLQALRLEAKMLINYIVKQVVLFDDRVEIHLNSPNKEKSPDESLGFSIYRNNILISYKIPQRRNIFKLELEIELKI